MVRKKDNESWGTRLGLVLAMAGNAVGLGNFLRFPVQAVQNGGGAFIIPYFICFLLMGIPLLWVEWATGRFGGNKGHHSTPFILDSMTKQSIWKYVGVFGIFTNLAVAAYYCYIESWTMTYVVKTLLGHFVNTTPEKVSAAFDCYLDFDPTFTGLPFEAVFAFVICVILNAWVLSKGLVDGVEKAAKIGMPMLILFGVALSFSGITLQAGERGAIYDGTVGLNYLWTPDFTSLTNPSVWLAAAGQIFFTLSVGMGTIQCYASYVKKNDDITLNAMSAGWMNEFVEVCLGSAILIPIAVGYLGIDKVLELTQQGALGLGFRTMPYLFSQWGEVLGIVAGAMFFGLLFFAGLTSSLAMGTPWVGFLQDEFKWNRKQAAWSFGAIVFMLGLPTVLFFRQGVFDEFDYWAGTVSLVLFALLESILFAWIFGMDKGWKAINDGGDIQVPEIFKFIIKYVTPAFLLLVFVASLLAPEGRNWYVSVGQLLDGQGWSFSDQAIVAKLMNQDINKAILVADGFQQKADMLFKKELINGSRLLLLLVFGGICLLVYIAGNNRKKR